MADDLEVLADHAHVLDRRAADVHRHWQAATANHLIWPAHLRRRGVQGPAPSGMPMRTSPNSDVHEALAVLLEHDPRARDLARAVAPSSRTSKLPRYLEHCP